MSRLRATRLRMVVIASLAVCFTSASFSGTLAVLSGATVGAPQPNALA